MSGIVDGELDKCRISKSLGDGTVDQGKSAGGFRRAQDKISRIGNMGEERRLRRGESAISNCFMRRFK